MPLAPILWRYLTLMHDFARLPLQNIMLAKFYSLNNEHAVFLVSSPPIYTQNTQPAPIKTQKPSKPCLFLDMLPVEVRFRIYDTIIHTHRVLCLNLMDVHSRRIGIMEPLAKTNRVIRAELQECAAGRPPSNLQPVVGLV